MSAAGEVGRKSRALWCDTVVRLASALKDDVLGHSSGEKAVRWMHGHHTEKKQRKTTSRRCTMSKRPKNYRIYVVRAAYIVVTDLLIAITDQWSKKGNAFPVIRITNLCSTAKQNINIFNIVYFCTVMYSCVVLFFRVLGSFLFKRLQCAHRFVQCRAEHFWSCSLLHLSCHVYFLWTNKMMTNRTWRKSRNISDLTAHSLRNTQQQKPKSNNVCETVDLKALVLLKWKTTYCSWVQVASPAMSQRIRLAGVWLTLSIGDKRKVAVSFISLLQLPERWKSPQGRNSNLW